MEIITIAVCIAKGTMEPQMKVHLRAALNVGCTKQEIVEFVTHMACLCMHSSWSEWSGYSPQVFQEYNNKGVTQVTIQFRAAETESIYYSGIGHSQRQS